MQLIADFFAEVDRRWPREPAGKVRLPLIGCGALMLQANYERGTKDSDVFETADLTEAVKRNLVAIAGQGTDLHKRWNLYVDIVANGVPFLPHAPLWHPVPELNQALVRLEIVVLDVVDVVVSGCRRVQRGRPGRSAACIRHQSPSRRARHVRRRRVRDRPAVVDLTTRRDGGTGIQSGHRRCRSRQLE